jgi:cytochrome c-type biogenesis protein CcmH
MTGFWAGMTWFWIIGAALAAVALLAVVRPLVSRRAGAAVSSSDANLAVYRDQRRELEADLAAGTLAQADYDSSRRELESRLLIDVPVEENQKQKAGRVAAIVAGIAIPLCAAAIYFAVGSPAAIVSAPEHMEAMVARLAAHLRENPDDANGWKLLGRSRAALGRFPDAVEAYARAAERLPRDAQLLADFADALGMARGQSLRGEPEKLVLRALEIDPENLKALALAGTAAFDRRDFGAAAAYWQRMLPLVGADSEDARVVRENVEEAGKLSREALKLAGNTRSLRGKIEVSRKLAERLQPDDTLFVIARAEKGPPMPLAAMKLRARDLPLEFSLDDSMAMAPEMALSKFSRIVVTARVSRSGQAAPQPGDLQGSSRPVANDAQAVRVLIDTVVR